MSQATPGPHEGAEPEGVESASTSEGRRRRTVVAILLGIAATVVGLDLLTKTLAVANLDPMRPVHIIGDVVTLRLVRNSGAAFSMASGYTWILTIVALCVVIGIVRYSGRLRSPWWILGLGLVLGGAMGNLADRIFRSPGPLRGHVVDFVSVGWWPVFNVADSAVVCGAILLVALSLFGFEYDGSRTGWAARHDRGDLDPDDPDPGTAHDTGRTGGRVGDADA
ncbi:signal peptidase II [Gordonia sp. OPL2]|uniref:signal peptidase II n=1 Tax=Gordonia sp. OPL2 TaxID=2486274 RepID=UPI0016556814|nr:signal peptidase II [Gordonia sp. OPL2]ROZ88804.1 signal peptidase II [Gordonia sp. OPL2]